MHLKVYKTRFIYVSLAILCLLIFVSSSIFIMKFTKNENVMKKDNTEVKEVFKYDNKNIKDSCIIFLKIISSTNSNMALLFKEKYELEDYSLKTLLKDIDLRSLIRVQFPAFLKLDGYDINILGKTNNTLKAEDNYDPEVLQDIIYIEDDMENVEGELLKENQPTTSLEGIPVAENIETLKVNKDKDYVLIYHTHGTEAYLPIKENNFHTTERQYNMITIGNIITDILIKHGHKVTHIDLYHDSPSYNKSYVRSLNTITNAMKENDNLKIVFDLHRDGIEEDASYIKKAIKQSKIEIDGKNVATFSFVIGPDSPNKVQVLEFAKYIKSVSDKLYPGLCKGIIIKPACKFNQFVTDYYALIEVGSNLNTIDEAKESAKLIGEILNIVIEKIQE